MLGKVRQIGLAPDGMMKYDMMRQQQQDGMNFFVRFSPPPTKGETKEAMAERRAHARGAYERLAAQGDPDMLHPCCQVVERRAHGVAGAQRLASAHDLGR